MSRAPVDPPGCGPAGPHRWHDSAVSEVVIGEAVALDLRPARVPSRALALALDALLLGVVLLLLLVGLVVAGARFDPALTAAVTIAVLVLTLVGWPTLWETLTRGRSPGKYALGLRVVRDDGGPIRFRHALTRALAGLVVDFGVLGFGGTVAVVVSASSTRGKRVGDLLAGTIVLRERVPGRTAADGIAPVLDPRLAGWAATLQLAGLPDGLATAARGFLLRRGDLDAGARVALATRLADQVAGSVAPGPPPGLPAEEYLAAVLAERFRRETLRHAGPAGPARPPGAPVPGTPFPGAPFPGAPFPGAPVPGPPFPGAPSPAGSGAPRPSAPSTGGFAPPG